MFLTVVLFVTASLSSVSTNEVGCKPGQWRCDDGQCVTAAVCDGELQCRDGSDESLARCKGTQRPLLALILHCSQPGSGSHQVCPEACRRWPEYCYYAVAAENGVPGTCKLPLFPGIGSYSIEAIEQGTSTGLADFTLLYSCPPGFTLHGYHPRCVSGSWTADFPNCRQDKKCQLKKDLSVDYVCPDVPNHKCPEWVGSDLRVESVCRPGYRLVAPSTIKYCIDGIWNYDDICPPECGTASVGSEVSTRRGEMPWYTGVYRKLTRPYMQICGGSLVSTTVVISAAHCFWSDREVVAPAEHFAVGVGKIYRPWGTDNDGQKYNVSDITVPPRFRGSRTSFQDDIALVVLATRVVVTTYVRPVCLEFQQQSDELQLRPGNVGKIAVWSGKPVLKIIEMSSVDVTQCYTALPDEFASYITSDKICAESRNGTAICRGDSGGGLVFPSIDSGVKRWYLRGIASTAPQTETQCADRYTAFTQLAKHEFFIMKILMQHRL